MFCSEVDLYNFLQTFYAFTSVLLFRIFFMKPQCIGIIGGAGPLAGAYFLERIFSLSLELYGCYRDADFPKVILISYPFSEMLSPDIDIANLQKELSNCIEQLRNSGATVLAIACNTLHVFLEEKNDLSDLVNLPLILAEELSQTDQPLVFCTSTSAQFELHKRYFPCNYPDEETQKEVDRIIDQILRGADQSFIVKKLEKLLQEQTSETIVLGCTELSLYSGLLTVPNKLVVDPLEVMAKRTLQRAFLSDEVKYAI